MHDLKYCNGMVSFHLWNISVKKSFQFLILAFDLLKLLIWLDHTHMVEPYTVLTLYVQSGTQVKFHSLEELFGRTQPFSH